MLHHNPGVIINRSREQVIDGSPFRRKRSSIPLPITGFTMGDFYDWCRRSSFEWYNHLNFTALLIISIQESMEGTIWEPYACNICIYVSAPPCFLFCFLKSNILDSFDKLSEHFRFFIIICIKILAVLTLVNLGVCAPPSAGCSICPFEWTCSSQNADFQVNGTSAQIYTCVRLSCCWYEYDCSCRSCYSVLSTFFLFFW